MLLLGAEQALAKGDIWQVQDAISEVQGVFGINLDPDSAAYRQLGLAFLKQFVKAVRAIEQRNVGKWTDTPPLQIAGVAHAGTGENLRRRSKVGNVKRDRAPGTLSEYERAIKMFAELHGHLPVVQIKRSHARQFREALQDVPARRSGKLLDASLPQLAEWGREHPDVPKITAGTVNKQLTAVQAIANWAHDNGMIPDDVQWSDPFRRMRLGEEEAVRGGAPFELRTFR